MGQGVPEDALDEEGRGEDEGSEEQCGLHECGLEEAQGSDGQEGRQTVPVDAHQLHTISLTSTTDTRPPKMRTSNAII